jgi:hypothetical protein
MLTSRSATMTGGLLTLLILSASYKAGAVVPQSNVVLSWEPHGHFLQSLEPELSDRVGQVQEYTFISYREHSFDDSPEECSVSTLRNTLTAGKGII